MRCAVQEVLKAARRQYLQAHEQIFFPLNIEVQKAETRVMTYLAREEIRYRTSYFDSDSDCASIPLRPAGVVAAPVASIH